MKVLVTGGCGYIGSHTIVDLIEHGFTPISVDNLSNSDEKPLTAIAEITGQKVKNYQIDLCDLEATRQIFAENKDIIGVIHFAALKAVGESVEQPMQYFRNNINSLLNVLDCAQQAGVNNFIFSSSCSVYGNAKDLPVTESTAFEEAESPYARTKQIGEKIIQDFCVPHPEFKATLLRYFNPAGAHPSILLGESPVNPALNLVPVITETAIGKRQNMTVFGTDYDTSDGSCVRDYIHVMDLANAHTKSLQYLMGNRNDKAVEILNLGVGKGVSVLEAIEAFEQVSGQQLRYSLGDRRSGDVIAIYADPKQAVEKLGWSAQYTIKDIMKTAWEWEKIRTGVAVK